MQGSRLGAAVAAVLLLALGCSGGDGTDAAKPGPGSATTTTTVPPPAPSTTLPDITEVPRPENVADEAFVWFTYPAGAENTVLLGVLRSAALLPHPALLLVPASAGLTVDHVTFAEELVARGLDVAIGCWFGTDARFEIASDVIPCSDAPSYKGVADAAVPDFDSLVEAAHRAFGADRDLAIYGASRGAGIAALRAAGGSPEPLILVSGLYEGWNGIGSPPGNEVDVVARAAGIRAPTLLFHGTADGAVPVSQAQHLEQALRTNQVDVAAYYYEGAGHNLAGIPEVKADIVDRVVEFLCTRFACSGRD